MATASVLPVMTGDGGNGIHPFFRPGGRNERLNGHESETDTTLPLDGASDSKSKAKHNRKAKAPREHEAKGKQQQTLQALVNPKPRMHDGEGADEIGNADTAPAPAPASGSAGSRAKRRRTGQHRSVDVGQPESETVEDQPEIVPSSPPLPQAARSTHASRHADVSEVGDSTSDPIWRYTSPPPVEPVAQPPVRRAGSPRAVLSRSPPLSDADLHQVSSDTTAKPKTPPKKMLRLNASGKFSSPVSKALKSESLPSTAAPRRGRPRKSKGVAKPRELVVAVSYGQDSESKTEIGQRIDRILSGEESLPPPPQLSTPKKKRTPKKPKTRHPFFNSKPAPPQMKLESPPKASATTPGKLKRQIMADRIPEVPREVLYAVGSNLLKDRLMVKHSGARDPLWPDRGQAHVRGFEFAINEAVSRESAPEVARTRKRKQTRMEMPANESLLHRFSESLVVEPERTTRTDGLTEPHQALRVPNRLLMSGHEVRARIASELSVPLNVNDSDELQDSAHPGLHHLWHQIPRTLSAFDDLRGETSSWTLKYAPEAACRVLQPATEMSVLKDWLLALTVTAVEGSSAPQTTNTATAEVKPRKKRRRKNDDMHDFLVDDVELVADMDELTDPQDIAPSSSKQQRSMIRQAIDGHKLSNIVLLSGPSGCGKTAAAYAVARELGFKVFEISSSERRTGKDVLDKIGDMTENHLVKHHGTEVDPGELSATEDASKARLDEAFQRDLASGRQGKMNAFFKPQAATKASAPKEASKPAEVVKAKTLKAVEQALKKPPKDQQQSLILLEEVDIVFKEDKEFWNTVLKLVLNSKRPFIMTCNDEDLVPIQAMDLHAILRFSAPPADLAVDYMLLLAAAEGHLLQRETVAQLYASKSGDLRASISELDFWCQMAVGDPKGGLSWIYQRWPPGSDVDDRGRKIRVVSEGTYVGSRSTGAQEDLSDEDNLIWAWLQYGSDLTKCVTGVEFESDGEPMSRKQRLAALDACALRTDSLSAMDVCSRVYVPGTVDPDTTTPEMPDKARNHYIEGMRLLQTDERIDHEKLGIQLIAAAVCSLSRIAKVSPPLNAIRCAKRGASSLTRHDFAAFDTIANGPESVFSNHPGNTESVFDGPFAILTTDLAPYVRSIVQYDLALEEQRERLSSLLADGSDGRRFKRARTTRAARSALEGSQRASTRRDRWFGKELDLSAVLRTGGESWPKAMLGGTCSGTSSVEEEPFVPASSNEGA